MTLLSRRSLRVRHSLFAISLVALTAGCSNSPEKAEKIPGSFRTNILADGTKLFTYTLGDTRGDGRAAPPGAMPPPGARMKLPDPHDPLEALLEQNKYCRDGYVTLEQYRMGMQQVIRGECRDDATDVDRQRFSQK